VGTEAVLPIQCHMIIPGGIAEMFYGVSREQIILRKRKGFVKYAMMNGCHLVPAYGFGTNQQFHTLVEAGGMLAKLSSILRISITPWVDRFWIPFGFVPSRHKVLVAVGKPIPVEKVEKPTDAEVDALHTKYCDSLRALFNEHKASVGWQDKQLYFEDEKPEKKKTQ